MVPISGTSPLPPRIFGLLPDLAFAVRRGSDVAANALVVVLTRWLLAALGSAPPPGWKWRSEADRQRVGTLLAEALAILFGHSDTAGSTAMRRPESNEATLDSCVIPASAVPALLFIATATLVLDRHSLRRPPGQAAAEARAIQWLLDASAEAILLLGRSEAAAVAAWGLLGAGLRHLMSTGFDPAKASPASGESTCTEAIPPKEPEVDASGALNDSDENSDWDEDESAPAAGLSGPPAKDEANGVEANALVVLLQMVKSRFAKAADWPKSDPEAAFYLAIQQVP